MNKVTSVGLKEYYSYSQARIFVRVLVVNLGMKPVKVRDLSQDVDTLNPR